MSYNKIAKDSSLLRDFVAGVEPTGVYTFEHARTNKGRHGLHRAMGDIGGFAGGAAISTVLGAAGTYGAGKLLRKAHLGKYLVEAGKDQMLLFKPHKAMKTLKNLPRSTKVMHGAQEMTTDMNKIYRSGNTAINPQSRVFKSSKNYFESAASYAKNTGEEAQDTFRKGLALVGGAAAGTLGGGLNALSAHAQYNAGLKQNIYRKPKTDNVPKYASLISLGFRKSN